MSKQQIHQHIAVFGQAGSGKTVLLSSLFGRLHEPSAIRKNGYRFLAEDSARGNKLLQKYLGMKEQAQAPMQDKFVSSPFSFRFVPESQPLDAKRRLRTLALLGMTIQANGLSPKSTLKAKEMIERILSAN